jgi:ATP-dependent DNA ligase
LHSDLSSSAARGGTLGKDARDQEQIRLSPATRRISDATGWLKLVGATLDGVIAKRLDLDYRSGERTGMQKIKNYRSADCERS